MGPESTFETLCVETTDSIEHKDITNQPLSQTFRKSVLTTGFEVFKGRSIKITVCWNMMPRILVNRC
jgi:hypothetical protein